MATASIAALMLPTPAAAALHVVPFPGTPDASPVSRVIFPSRSISDMGPVTVTGSSSGSHTGHLLTLPDHAGVAFVPDRPFTPGEHVSVAAVLRSRVAAATSGVPRARALRFSFSVGVTTPGPPIRAHHGPSPTQSFHSAPGLRPPRVSATADPDSRSGAIFLTPQFAPQNGPMILDGRGRLVWFHAVPDAVTNLEAQRYEGHPVLTWWQSTKGSHAEDMIVGRSYRTLAVVHAGYGYVPDDHEFQLTPQGTALIDTFVPVKADLRAVGGPSDGPLMDCVIQELDVKSGQVLWEWHALGHVPLSASYFGTPDPSTPYDFFHMNSIQQLPDGNLIISARHTWAVYEIDKQDGSVIWTLGGKDSSFKIAPRARFEWQHSAHLYPDSTLSLFDDAAPSTDERQSSAKLLRLNTTAMTASLVRRYTHFSPLLTSTAGNFQLLPNHDVFVGWGRQPDFSEYTRDGRQIFNGTFRYGVRSYRAYRFPWAGQPATPPSMAAVPQTNGSLKVYASWNGATDVASWRLLGGPAPHSLRSLSTRRRSGFETAIAVASPPHYVAVQALNARGKALGTSATRSVAR